MKSVGQIIRAYRKKTKLTQIQLARIIRVRQLTVSNWERDFNLPNQEIIIDRLQEIIPALKGRKDLRGGEVRLEEGAKGHRDPVNALFWTAEMLSDRFPDRLSVKYFKDEVKIKIKMK